MADDLLRQFYVRAARTLSIAYEVLQQLSRCNYGSAEPAITRLELELAGWQAEVDAHTAYQTELEQFYAADAVWRHIRSIHTEPEVPAWPTILPKYDEIGSVIKQLCHLKRDAERFREVVQYSLSFDNSLSIMSGGLALMGLSLDSLKQVLEEPSPVEVADPIQYSPHDDIDELVTLDQVAPLTGLTKRTLERYLKRGQLPDPEVRGGGGRSHKWFWRNLRGPLSKVARLKLPERFPGSRIA